MKLDERVISILREFKQSHPWSGSRAEKQAKFAQVVVSLNRIFKRNTKLKFEIGEEQMSSYSSYYNVLTDTITLVGKFSVITLLHEYAHALFGSSEEVAQEWAIKHFFKVFPEKLPMVLEGRLIVRPVKEGESVSDLLKYIKDVV